MKKILMIMMSAALFVCCDGNDPVDTPQPQSLSINTEAIALDAAGTASQNSVTVTSSADWTLSGDTSWCTPSVQKGGTGATVTFTASANTSEDPREVNFYFICGDAARKLTVMQSPHGIVEMTTDIYSVTSAGGILTVMLTSNLDSSNCEISEDWVTLYRPGGQATGTQWMQFNVETNTDWEDRSATITLFKGTDAEKTVTVNQAKYVGVRIDGISSFDFGVAGGTATVTASGSVDFNPVISAANAVWLSATEDSSSGTTVITKTFTITCAASDFSRNGTVTLTPVTTGTSAVINVTQTNPNPTLFDIPDPVFAGRLAALGYIAAKDDRYNLTYTGYAATALQITGMAYVNMESIEGIERLENLTSLIIEDCKLKKADLSRNTKLTSVGLSYIPLEELILGDINVTTYSNNNYMYAYYANTVRSKSFTASGSKLKTISIYHTSSADYDEIEWIDITGCPALTSLNCNRNSGKLTAIYVTQAQKDAYDAGMLTITTHNSFDKTTGIVVR